MTKKAIKISRYLNNRGAILLDILISIGIIALLTTISTPYLHAFQSDLQLNGAAKNLTSDLRYAQQLTISEQNIYEVELDPSLNNYSIVKTGSATTTIKSVALPQGVEFSQIDAVLNNEVIFNSFGGVNESGAIVLSNNTKTETINVKPSGYIQLSQ